MLLNQSSKLSESLTNIFNSQEEFECSLTELMQILNEKKNLPPEAVVHVEAVKNSAKN